MTKQLLKLILSGVFLIGMIPSVHAQSATDLFISEYVEGSSNNKAIEIYNGTSSPIDLTAGNYLVQMYFNGSISAGLSIPLTGVIPANGVYIVAHGSATFITTNGGSVTANVTNSGGWYNGDDAIILRKGGASGTILDVVGQLGLDPGTEWGTGVTSTADNTIRRKSGICTGDVVSSNMFDPATEWDGFATDVFTGLGSHTSSCSTPGTSITLSPSTLNFTTNAGTPSSPQSYLLTGNSLTDDVTVTGPATFEVSSAAGGPFTGSLIIDAATANAGTTLYVQYNPASAGNHSGNITHVSGPASANLAVQGSSGSASIIPIYSIQGTTDISPYEGTVVTTEGVVVADFQGTGQLSGFYIQNVAGDGNTSTSDGVFIFNTTYSVGVGDRVRLTGEVDEYFNLTEIKNLTALSILSYGNALPAPVEITLPISAFLDFEKYEGMFVRFPQTLTATEVFTLGRYGEVSLSVYDRLYIPTNFIDPNDPQASGTTSNGGGNLAAVFAQQDLNNRSRILLDDASSVQNPAIVPFLNPVDTTLRVGSTVTNVTGILSYDFSKYRIQPTVAPAFDYAPRPDVPSVGEANVKVASFNVLNYFNGNGAGGGFPTARGANTLEEFNRQRAKIIAAISRMEADVIGLIEMENDGDGPASAIADLVSGLNTATAAGTYAYVLDPAGANGNSGTDAIKQAIIYKPATVTPFGAVKADMHHAHNRPPVAQTFTLNSNGEKFTFIVNHFKSKSCTDATGANFDQLDGQSCYNDARKSQATALLNFISTLKTATGDQDILTVGDYNAYGEEDPMDVLLAGGLQNLLPNSYSYVFDGQSGSLDHALVSGDLRSSVSGAAKWHINADEPIFKDYNQEFNPAYAYSQGPYRSSDHDPVLIGLNLESPGTSPVVSNISKSTNEDVAIAFAKSDFADAFTDADGDTLVNIEIVSLPTLGKLKLNNVDVTSGQVIAEGQLSALSFVPDLNISGSDTFSWKGADHAAYSQNAKVFLAIAAVNDAPVVTNFSKTVTEDSLLVIPASDFLNAYSDVEGKPLDKITVVSVPSLGKLKLNNVNIYAGQVIGRSKLSGITFVPDPNAFGSSSFTWKAYDFNSYSLNATVSITVVAVNDAPLASDFTKTVNEDQTLNFTAFDFEHAYTDVEGKPLNKITVVTLPSLGKLKLNNTDVFAGQRIGASQLGLLSFVPEVNVFGSASFEWKASDFVNYSQNAVVTINITSVNDIPSVSITGPPNGSVFAVMAPIPFTATASDIDGTVKVQFYAGSTFIGEDLSEPFSFDWNAAEGGTYLVTAKAVDNEGGEKVSAPVSVTVGCTANGGITRYVYASVYGSYVSDLTSSPKYPNEWEKVTTLSSFEILINQANHFGTRVIGYICAPQTGNYTFQIAGDDRAELWLSTDSSRVNRVKIATVPNLTGFREYTKYAAQTSVPIHLVKGAVYFVEALHKESNQNDHLSVAWTMPDNTFQSPISGVSLSTYSGQLRMEETSMELSESVSEEIMVSPVPAVDFVNIEFHSNGGGTQISVVDAFAHEVLSTSINAVAGSNSVQLSVQNLASGVYFVNVVSQEKRSVHKIIVAGK